MQLPHFLVLTPKMKTKWTHQSIRQFKNKIFCITHRHQGQAQYQPHSVPFDLCVPSSQQLCHMSVQGTWNRLPYFSSFLRYVSCKQDHYSFTHTCMLSFLPWSRRASWTDNMMINLHLFLLMSLFNWILFNLVITDAIKQGLVIQKGAFGVSDKFMIACHNALMTLILLLISVLSAEVVGLINLRWAYIATEIFLLHNKLEYKRSETKFENNKVQT